jgi:ATP-dependent Clp protease ATP-binding subunit ClpC
VIGATTSEEYRKYIEKDSALDRRFQSVLLTEPSRESAIEILKGLCPRYERHHKVIITEEAIVAAVDFSIRYQTDRKLPDKAIDLIDEAAARARVHQFGEKKDKGIRTKLAGNTQQSGREEVAQILSEMTGIHRSKICEEFCCQLFSLEERLRQRVIGQDEAVASVSKAIRRNYAGMRDENRPVAGFLFMGPSGKLFVHFVQILVIFLSKMQELHKKIKKTFDFFFLM